MNLLHFFQTLLPPLPFPALPGSSLPPFSVDAKMGKSSAIVDPWVFKMLKRLKSLGCPTIKERERPRLCIHIGIYTEGQSELASERDPAGTWRHNCWLYQAYLTPRATHPPPSPLEKYTCDFNVLDPPPCLFVLLKRLQGCYACESNSDFKEPICVLKQGRVVWHFCEKWVNLLLEVPTQLLLVEPDSKWSETFLPVLGTIRFKSIRGNGFNWWILATSILRLARNIPLPRNPTISNLSLSDIRNYPLSFVYISIIRYLLSISRWVVRTFSQWNSTSCVFNSLSLWS